MGSREALGQFLDPKRGGRQKEHRKEEGRKESQAKGGSQPKVPTCTNVKFTLFLHAPVEKTLQR